MKKILAMLLAVVMVLSLAACGGGSTTPTTEATKGTEAPNPSSEATQAPTTEATEAPTASSEVISLTVWGAEEDQNLLKDLVAKFEAQYSDYSFDIKIGVESESTAKDTVLADPEAAADVFAFADDQLPSLVSAGALLGLDQMDAVLQAYTGKTLEDIKAANSGGAIKSCTSDGAMYAFPMGGGNNYFLYYDSTKITAEQAASWDTLLDAAQAAGGKVGMTLASGWYNASFFLGAGFTATRNADGSTYVDWNGTSATGISGVDVVKSMLNIAAHPAFMAIPDGQITANISSGDLVAVVSGTWDATAAEPAFGEGYAATKLPTFTCAGEQIQQACFTGFKLMGVNAYSKNAGWAVLLAEFLTNEESQAARYDARQLMPSNLVAASVESISSNIALSASAAQDNVGGVTQNVGDKYWTPTATLGESIAQGTIDVNDDAAIQEALDTMVAGVTAPLD